MPCSCPKLAGNFIVRTDEQMKKGLEDFSRIFVRVV